MHSFNRIFNIGLHKAGTTSLSEALEILGIPSVHFMYKKRRVKDIIYSNIENKVEPLKNLLKFKAFSDYSGSNFLETLDLYYPGSKYIITTRDLDSWIDSKRRHVLKNKKNKDYNFDFVEINEEKWVKNRKLFFEKTDLFFRNRKDDVLYLDILSGDGWPELCHFLELDIPEVPFPVKNKYVPKKEGEEEE